jgi:hypothetical protein
MTPERRIHGVRGHCLLLVNGWVNKYRGCYNGSVICNCVFYDAVDAEFV